MNALDREYDFIFMKTEEEIRLIDHGHEQRYLYKGTSCFEPLAFKN